MKRIIICTLTLFTLATLFLACNSKKSELTASIDDAKSNLSAMIDSIVYKDTIHNSTFTAWTTRWQANQKPWSANVNNSINYFGMPLSDLANILTTKGAVSSRFYLGLTAQDSIHLVVVGVDAQGNNMLDNSKDQYAYDVSRPCPNACGEVVNSAKPMMEKK